MTRARVRSRVEHVFAAEKRRMGLVVRTIRLARANAKTTPQSRLQHAPARGVGRQNRSSLNTDHGQRLPPARTHGHNRHDRRTIRARGALNNRKGCFFGVPNCPFMGCERAPHPTLLRCTPAMPAGAAKSLWDLGDMVRVLKDWESRNA